MSKVIDNLNRSLEYHVGLNNKQNKIDNNLETNAKTIVEAINEIFSSTNNKGKQLIATAIGSPLLANDDFNVMSEKINLLLEDLSNALEDKGIKVSKKKLKEMIQDLNNLIIPDLQFDSVVPDGWTTKASMANARYGLTTSAVDGKIYAIGGMNSTYYGYNECYDPLFDTWENKAPLPTPRQGVASGVLNNKIHVIGGMDGVANYSNNDCYDPVTNTWTSKTNMSVMRYSTGVTVNNGMLYCIGGSNSQKSFADNECYDPITNTWSNKASLIYPVYSMALESVNNKIYCIAGNGFNLFRKNNQCYDPITNTWSSKTSISSERDSLCSSVINNKIYVIGGFISSYVNINNNSCYDPSTDTWEEKAVLPTASRAYDSAVVNDKIYVIGGYISSTIARNICYTPAHNKYIVEDFSYEVYDKIIAMIAKSLGEPVSEKDSIVQVCDKIDNMTQDFRDKLINKGVVIEGTEKMNALINKVDEVGSEGELIYVPESWTHEGNLSTTRYSVTAQAYDDCIYVIGGINYTTCTNTCYCTTSKTWQDKANIPTNRYNLTSQLIDDKIYCIGGCPHTNINECYDISTNTWTDKATMSTKREELGSAKVNNKIYCIGGYPSTDINECYDPATNTWTTKTKLPYWNNSTRATAIGDNVYVVGGFFSNSIVGYNYFYNTVSNTWTQKQSLITFRHSHSLSVVDNKIYCIGGYSNGVIATNECYDPEKNTWESKLSMPGNRQQHASVVVNNNIYVIGGRTTNSADTTDISYYIRAHSYEGPNASVQALVNVIGEPCTIEDSVYDICDKITDITTTFRNKLNSKGVAVSESDKYNSLVNKLDEISMDIPGCLSYTFVGGKASLWSASQMATAQLVNNKIYLFGNVGGTGTVQVFDPIANNTTKVTTTVPVSSLYNYASAAVGNDIYLFNNSNELYACCYNPISNTWTTKNSFTTGRSGGKAANVDGKIYLIAGGNKVNECYDPITNTWTTKAEILNSNQYFGIAVHNRKIYCICGTGDSYYSDASRVRNQCYDPDTNTWSSKADAWIQVHNVSAATVKNKIVVVGGTRSTGTVVPDCQFYDVNTNTWGNVNTMPNRSETCAVAFNNFVFALGGRSNTSSNPLTDIMCIIP